MHVDTTAMHRNLTMTRGVARKTLISEADVNHEMMRAFYKPEMAPLQLG